jgi:hypothetical protein
MVFYQASHEMAGLDFIHRRRDTPTAHYESPHGTTAGDQRYRCLSTGGTSTTKKAYQSIPGDPQGIHRLHTLIHDSANHPLPQV